MADYQVISDGSCDLGKARTDRLDIGIIPYYVSFDGEKFYKEIEEMDVREFYEHMVKFPKVFPKTSLPPIQDYVDAFLPAVERGQGIICLCLSEKFSGSANSARNAAQIIKEQYKDARIAVVDTTLATALQGLLVIECARMRDDGISFESALDKIEKMKVTGRLFFSVGSMDYLIHGGRVGRVKGLAAGALGIKPMISLKNGEIYPEGVTRSQKKAFARIIDQAKSYFLESGENANDYVYASGYGYDYGECVSFKEQLVASMKEYSSISDMEIYQIGATIGVHTGPYPLGMGFLKRYERV
ncbi:MAG: DegV family protein [Clostridiales bacterium]|nr:DegV family protein [Clostridiales bacterium]